MSFPRENTGNPTNQPAKTERMSSHALEPNQWPICLTGSSPSFILPWLNTVFFGKPPLWTWDIFLISQTKDKSTQGFCLLAAIAALAAAESQPQDGMGGRGESSHHCSFLPSVLPLHSWFSWGSSQYSILRHVSLLSLTELYTGIFQLNKFSKLSGTQVTP